MTIVDNEVLVEREARMRLWPSPNICHEVNITRVLPQGPAQLVQEGEMGHDQGQTSCARRNDSGKRICHNIGGAWLVFDNIIKAKELREIRLLLRSLNYLGHKVLQTPVIRQDRERRAEEVVTPLPNRGGDGVEFSDIRRGSLQTWTKHFAKIGDRVLELKENNTHG